MMKKMQSNLFLTMFLAVPFGVVGCTYTVPQPDGGLSPDMGGDEAESESESEDEPDAGGDEPDAEVMEADAEVVEPDMGPDAMAPDAEVPVDAAPLPECVFDDDCDDGRLCEDGECAECTDDDQCDGDLFCNTAMDPNQCVECRDTSDCGVCTGTVCFGGSCVTVSGGELCDGADNNCDGAVDEVFTDLGSACDNGQLGVCLRTATVSCTASGLDTECPALAVLPSMFEVCDSVDNDCDGETDEALGMLSCGVGACASTIAACVDGVSQLCVSGMPASEVCDSVDNNCNGLVDDGLETTTCGLGMCEHTVENCVGGLTQTCDGFAGATPETCDGEDNNCDGMLDNALGSTTCGVGNCVNTVENCVGGLTQTCDGFAGATPETCDGADEDCDGVVDNDQPAFVTICGEGVCAAEGSASCTDGVYTEVCTPGDPPTTSDFTCDMVDEDCDGEADEDFGGEDCDGGDGDLCEEGMLVCVAGEEACTDTTDDTVEICDSADNDCDNAVDEGCAPTGSESESESESEAEAEAESESEDGGMSPDAGMLPDGGSTTAGVAMVTIGGLPAGAQLRDFRNNLCPSGGADCWNVEDQPGGTTTLSVTSSATGDLQYKINGAVELEDGTVVFLCGYTDCSATPVTLGVLDFGFNGSPVACECRPSPENGACVANWYCEP